MAWNIDFHADFYPEFTTLPTDVRLELLAKLTLLEEFGPSLKRPHVDTLKGSAYANMKEIRFQAADGVWRVAFAFDPERSAILLVAGISLAVAKSDFIANSSRSQTVDLQPT